MIGSLVIGAIIGGAAMWFYGREIRQYVDHATRDARVKAADTLQSAAQGLQSAKDRLESVADTARSGDTSRMSSEPRSTTGTTMGSSFGDSERRAG